MNNDSIPLYKISSKQRRCGDDDNQEAQGLSGSEAEETEEDVEKLDAALGVKFVPCAQHQNYAHRGPLLRHLNLVEYVATVQNPISITGNDRDLSSPKASAAKQCSGKQAGRSQMSTFAYSRGHPLVDSEGSALYHQKLYSVQKTVMFSGQTPPTLPVCADTHLNAKLDAFAEYYLILFKPWDDELSGPAGDLTWESFVEFIAQLETSGTFWDQGRLGMIQNMVQANSLTAATKTLLSAYRFRCSRSPSTTRP